MGNVVNPIQTSTQDVISSAVESSNFENARQQLACDIARLRIELTEAETSDGIMDIIRQLDLAKKRVKESGVLSLPEDMENELSAAYKSFADLWLYRFSYEITNEYRDAVVNAFHIGLDSVLGAQNDFHRMFISVAQAELQKNNYVVDENAMVEIANNVAKKGYKNLLPYHRKKISGL